ncbi:MAG: hypothetical protein ACTSSP_00230 [Candidatus Asgardarchaeia archaeon]
MKIRTGFISNSSSSSFLCRGNFTPEEAKDILQETLDFYNKMCGTDKTFGSVFEEPRLGTKADFKFYSEDWEIGVIEEEVVGHLIINGCDDNSIPYELFYLIERKFDAQRFHLG